MPKRTASLKTQLEVHPVCNCIILTFVSGACIALGFFLKNPVVMLAGLLPIALYEAFRTWGITTKLPSMILSALIITDIILIIFNINFNIAKIFGSDTAYLAGYSLPLGDIKVVAPAIMAIIAVTLFLRTAGFYTKWLSVLIFAGSFTIIYILSPVQFPGIFKWGIREASSLLYYIHL
jgi:hypothetical protein